MTNCDCRLKPVATQVDWAHIHLTGHHPDCLEAPDAGPAVLKLLGELVAGIEAWGDAAGEPVAAPLPGLWRRLWLAAFPPPPAAPARRGVLCGVHPAVYDAYLDAKMCVSPMGAATKVRSRQE